MGTVLRVLRYYFQPTEEDGKRLLHLMARYTELCDALGDVARAHPDYLYAGQLSAADETKVVAADFLDIPSRYLNTACTRVLRGLRANGRDYRFADDAMPFLRLEERVVSVKILSREITKEPVVHISIAVDNGGRLVVPCRVELCDEQPASEVGGARLVHHRHNNTWFVVVTAEVDENSALLENEPFYKDEED